MTELSLAQRIKQQFEEDRKSPFPLEDVRNLRLGDSENPDLFQGQLELYLSTIAGYASRIDRLGRRPRIELVNAKQQLSQSFFEKYSSLIVCRDAISSESTPNLFRDMERADSVRRNLLIVIDEIRAQPGTQ